jgi:hypothetical protein
MSKTVRARIQVLSDNCWSFPTAGRRSPHIYWSLVRFERDENWERAEWTLLIELDGAPAAGQSVFDATISFVAPDAPHHLLEIGAAFELYSGKKVKAKGHIL